MSDYTKLKGIQHIGDVLLSKTLETNIITYFNWGLLEVGGFFNVSIPSPGVYGGDQHKLRLVSEDPYYSTGQVWEGFRSDWVWETGVEYDYQPIRVSGVNVDGTFYPTATTTGTYAHKINYPLGRVTFDNAIPPTSVVTCEHSYRYVHFTHGGVPWWRQIQTNSMRGDDVHFLQQGSGAWSILAQNRIQLPAVIVEATPRTSRRPYEIGSTRAWVRQDVLFHVLADNPDDVKFLHDAITYQWQKQFFLFDLNRMFQDEKFPLDAGGSPVTGAMMYPQLVAPTGEGGYRWNIVSTANMQSTDASMPGSIWATTIRGTFELDLP